MTVDVLSRMTKVLSFQAKAGIQEVFLSSNIREKNNIDSPLLISGITENENNKEKERKHWIPNQVGDDIGVVFGDDSCIVFGDDNGMVFGDEKVLGSSIKYFEDDSGCAFEDDKSPLSYLKKRIYKRQRISSSIPGNGN